MADEPKWLIDPKEFSDAWRALQARQEFQIDVTENVLLQGFVPDGTDNLFEAVHPTSIAHRVLNAVVTHSTVEYAITANDILIGFCYPMGWAFMPDGSYSAGSVPAGWRQTHKMCEELMDQLISDDKDNDTHHG